ncbi:unnamed protein product [Phaeothamnion confervicola]
MAEVLTDLEHAGNAIAGYKDTTPGPVPPDEGWNKGGSPGETGHAVSGLTLPISDLASSSNGSSSEKFAGPPIETSEALLDWQRTPVRELSRRRQSSGNGFGWFEGDELDDEDLDEATTGHSDSSALPTPLAQINQMQWNRGPNSSIHLNSTGPLSPGVGIVARAVCRDDAEEEAAATTMTVVAMAEASMTAAAVAAPTPRRGSMSKRQSFRLDTAAALAQQYQSEGTFVSRKSFYGGAETVAITVGCVRIRRGARNCFGGRNPSYAQYEIVVATSKELLRAWKRHSALSTLADYAAGQMLPKAVAAWRRLEDMKKGKRCLEPDYLRAKRMFVLSFLAELLADLSTPRLLLSFVREKETP